MSLDVVFTYKKLLALSWQKVVARFLVDFGNWSLKEILVGSKYRYCGLAKSLARRTGSSEDVGKGEELWS